MNFKIKVPDNDETICNICKSPIINTALVEVIDSKNEKRFYHYMCFTEEAKRKNCRDCSEQPKCNGLLDECSSTKQNIITKETIMKDMEIIFNLNTDIRNISTKDGLAKFHNYKNQVVITVDIKIFYRIEGDVSIENFIAYKDWYKEK